MPENDDSELFGGSVDRSKLEEMKAAAGDDPVKLAQVAEVQAQVDAVAESDAAAEKAREDALAAQQPQPTEQPAEETAVPVETAEYEAPPRAGAGSGREEWVAYAAQVDPELDTTSMTRDEIVAVLEDQE